MLNLRHAFCVTSSTSMVLSIITSPVCAPMPTSSSYWAHLSALTSGSKYSLMTLVNVESDLFRPCANLLNVLEPKL